MDNQSLYKFQQEAYPRCEWNEKLFKGAEE